MDIGNEVIVFDFQADNLLPLGKVVRFDSPTELPAKVVVEYPYRYTNGKILPTHQKFDVNDGLWDSEDNLCILPASPQNLEVRAKIVSRPLRLHFDTDEVEFLDSE